MAVLPRLLVKNYFDGVNMKYLECPLCGERFEISDMERDEGSPNGYICYECYQNIHQEEFIEEW